MSQCQVPCAQMARHLFGLQLYLAEGCCENSQSTMDPMQSKSGPSNDMLVSSSNHL